MNLVTQLTSKVRLSLSLNKQITNPSQPKGRAISVSSPDAPESLATEFLELANGCLCCSVKDSGAAAIEKLMRKQGAFDYIMLETTGLADPGACFGLALASLIYRA